MPAASASVCRSTNRRGRGAPHPARRARARPLERLLDERFGLHADLLADRRAEARRSAERRSAKVAPRPAAARRTRRRSRGRWRRRRRRAARPRRPSAPRAVRTAVADARRRGRRLERQLRVRDEVVDAAEVLLLARWFGRAGRRDVAGAVGGGGRRQRPARRVQKILRGAHVGVVRRWAAAPSRRRRAADRRAPVAWSARPPHLSADTAHDLAATFELTSSEGFCGSELTWRGTVAPARPRSSWRFASRAKTCGA